MKSYVKYAIGAGVIISGSLILLSWRNKAATLAASFLNEMEIGNNESFANSAFQQMLRNVGWVSGEAWCMYFAKAVYMQAFPKKSDAINSVLTGSTQQSFQNAIRHPELFKVITDGPARKGDIVIWQNTKKPSSGHAGIVLKKTDTDHGEVVEGNAGVSSNGEGQKVTINNRVLLPGTVEGSLKVLGFLRLKI